MSKKTRKAAKRSFKHSKVVLFLGLLIFTAGSTILMGDLILQLDTASTHFLLPYGFALFILGAIMYGPSKVLTVDGKLMFTTLCLVTSLLLAPVIY